MKIASLLLLCAIASCLVVGCAPDRNETVEARGEWWREKFDGHSYVVRNGTGYGAGSGIEHDPDCSCQKSNSSTKIDVSY